MNRFSALSLIRHAVRGHRDWRPQWRKPDPKPQYDAVIVGGGGHGFGAVYYLAAEHGMRNIAVIERGPIGLGSLESFPLQALVSEAVKPVLLCIGMSNAIDAYISPSDKANW